MKRNRRERNFKKQRKNMYRINNIDVTSSRSTDSSNHNHQNVTSTTQSQLDNNDTTGCTTNNNSSTDQVTVKHPFLLRPNEIPDDIICSICHNVPLQPIVLRQCEHIFCLNCIQQSFHHIGRICPIDRRECCDNTTDSTTTGTDSTTGTTNNNVDSSIQPLKENTFAYRVWCSIQVQCYYKTIGCNWIGSVYDYQKSHQYKCQYDPITIQKQIHKQQQKVEQSLLISQQCLHNTHEENPNDHAIIIDDIDTSDSNNTNNETSCTFCNRNKARLRLNQIDKERLVEENIILQNEIDDLINQVKSLKNKQREQVQKDKETLRPKHGVFDITYSYNRTTIVQLNVLLATYLENKPSIINTNRIYNCIKNCYTDYKKDYTDNPSHYFLDVRMLLATSISSNWFSSKQFNNLKQWYDEL